MTKTALELVETPSTLTVKYPVAFDWAVLALNRRPELVDAWLVARVLEANPPKVFSPLVPEFVIVATPPLLTTTLKLVLPPTMIALVPAKFVVTVIWALVNRR